MSDKTVIAFFPEAAFGPALNSVAIAQTVEKQGHKAVFLTDPGMAGLYKGYGFEEHEVNMSEPMPPEEMAKYWSDFINGHIPNFDLTPYEQLDNYVKECWEAIVETSIWAEKELPDILAEVKPDVVCVDNVILFPAIKHYAQKNGKAWVRIISCSENEISDPDIPPHLSGCSETDRECFEKFDAKFKEAVKECHARFNAFLQERGEEPYPLGEFFETSPHLNLLLYPEPVKFKRRKPLDPTLFRYLEGCVRQEKPYEIPTFGEKNDAPLVYVSFGSLGSGDTDLLKRIIDVLGGMNVRALVNVGEYKDSYGELPGNVHIDEWFPQPSVIKQVDAVIHHGGNNSFTECLFFGKPAIVMPYVWDGHDNATRVQETGHGLYMHRKNWTPEELRANLERLLSDQEIRRKLEATSAHMQSHDSPGQAATLLIDLAKKV